MTLARKNLDTPDVKRSFEHGDMQVITLGDTTFVRGVLRPGWRWSVDVKPGAGTGSCQVAHASYIISGRFAVRMDDGTEVESGPGDALVAGPGHDAWVIGDEPCVMVDVALTRSAGGGQARMVTCHPCGVEFRVQRADQVDELVAAVQQHASGSHGHDVAREHILSELVPA
jgi:predicted small metal-binding protein